MELLSVSADQTSSSWSTMSRSGPCAPLASDSPPPSRVPQPRSVKACATPCSTTSNCRVAWAPSDSGACARSSPALNPKASRDSEVCNPLTACASRSPNRPSAASPFCFRNRASAFTESGLRPCASFACATRCRAAYTAKRYRQISAFAESPGSPCNSKRRISSPAVSSGGISSVPA